MGMFPEDRLFLYLSLCQERSLPILVGRKPAFSDPFPLVKEFKNAPKTSKPNNSPNGRKHDGRTEVGKDEKT